MKIIRTPHDNFVKAMMEYPEVATDFFISNLPKDILVQVNLSTLRMENTTFIDAKLRKNESDLIFSVKRINSTRKAYLFVMLEHQSTSDPLMPFRVLYYVMHGIRRHILRHKKKPLPLPLVYPIVLYNGVEPWSHDRDFFNLFGTMELLSREIFLKPFQLIDVSLWESNDFRRTQVATLMLLSLYRSAAISLDEKIKLLVSTCHENGVHPDSDLGQIVLEYNTYLFEAKEGESGKYWDMYVRHFPPEFQESIMNLREATRNEAKLEGKLEALDATCLAIALLKKGKPLEWIAQETHLSKAEVERIKNSFLH